MARNLKILLTSPEVHPYAKTGGLADIAGALPKALKEKGHEVRVIMPAYKCIWKSGPKPHPLGKKIKVPVGGEILEGELLEGRLPGEVPIYFVGNTTYFDRDELYGTYDGDFPDNAERFIFFSRAVLEACRALGFQPDILHCNDWQTGLVPAFLKTLFKNDAWFENTRTVFSIHNIGYQGNFEPAAFAAAGLPKNIFHPGGAEYHGRFSLLKSGLIFADQLITVSKTYSKEIQTEEMGFGMDGILRQRSADLHGLLNGVDYQEWDPAHDPWIKKQYDPDHLEGKRRCREDLARRLSLKLDESTPILCMVTRLTLQKGVDLVMEGIEEILKLGSAFALLGVGEPRFESFFKELGQRYPERCGIFLEFDEALAHRVLAGSDLFLMPSYYEPCGLTQMYSLKYGTVPIVRGVGGLEDTVRTFNPETGQGTGFKFKPYAAKSLVRTVQKALSFYKDEALWRRLMLNGMNEDYGWDRAVGPFIRLYRKALRS